MFYFGIFFPLLVSNKHTTMGQMGSSPSRSTSHRRNARPPPPSPFLEWPVDLILYLLRQHLSPVSALSLSLTCKSLSALASCHGGGGHTTLSIPDPEEFLLLLEKDVGRTHYSCHPCSTLHPFSSCEPYALAKTRRARLPPSGSCFLSWKRHHPRLPPRPPRHDEPTLVRPSPRLAPLQIQPPIR